MRVNTIVFAIVILSCSSLATLVHAQRGGTASDSATLYPSPLAGYPGYFDSNFAAPKSLVFDLPPALNAVPLPMAFMDYGVSEKITVGTNLVTDALPLLLGGFGLSGKLRTLVYGTQTVQSAVTFYGGYMRMKLGGNSDDDEDEKEDDANVSDSSVFSINYMHLTSNTSYYLTPKMILTGQVGFGKYGLQINEPSDLDYVAGDIMMGFLGGSFQMFFTDTLGGTVAGLYPAYQRLTLDSAGAAIALDADTVNMRNALFRMFRIGMHYELKGCWLFEGGFIHMPPVSEGALWLGATVKI